MDGTIADLGKTGSADDLSVELSMRRTGMSFHRTRLSADRTLMSVIRTSLSLISFGFTILQLFNNLADNEATAQAGHRFGMILMLIGEVMLVLGILYQMLFMRGLRLERTELRRMGLIYAESRFPISMTLVVAICLLILGLVAMTNNDLRSIPIF
jgi:putative membrane protein